MRFTLRMCNENICIAVPCTLRGARCRKVMSLSLTSSSIGLCFSKSCILDGVFGVYAIMLCAGS